MKTQQFLKYWLITFVITISGIAILNILIDPYGLWGTARIDFINKLKPAAATRNKLVKPYQLAQFKAKTLIMGNSRPELGLNPESACWPEKFKPIYNQAIPGATLYSQFRLLQHTSYFNKPQFVVIAIDFIDFLTKEYTDKTAWPPINDVKNLSVHLDEQENLEYKWAILLDHFKITFSLDAFIDSLKTLYAQHDQLSDTRTESGFNPENGYYKIIQTEGQAILFSQKKKELFKRFNKPLYLYNKDRWSQAFETYKQLLSYTQKYHINTMVIINPYHYDYLSIIKKTGHWQLFKEWKIKIQHINKSFKNTQFWDFAIINQFTSEKPPVHNRINKKIKYFWEPGHYTQKMGEQILSTILKTNCVAPTQKTIKSL